jgi:hypothetical protein
MVGKPYSRATAHHYDIIGGRSTTAYQGVNAHQQKKEEMSDSHTKNKSTEKNNSTHNSLHFFLIL